MIRCALVFGLIFSVHAASLAQEPALQLDSGRVTIPEDAGYRLEPAVGAGRVQAVRPAGPEMAADQNPADAAFSLEECLAAAEASCTHGIEGIEHDDVAGSCTFICLVEDPHDH